MTQKPHTFIRLFVSEKRSYKHLQIFISGIGSPLTVAANIVLHATVSMIIFMVVHCFHFGCTCALCLHDGSSTHNDYTGIYIFVK